MAIQYVLKARREIKQVLFEYALKYYTMGSNGERLRKYYK